MPKMFIMQGLPASGKTTESMRLMAEALKENRAITRVSKDDIRAMLESEGWQWSRENEKDVIAYEDRKIVEAFEKGDDVIVDDTNFGEKHKTRLEALAQRYNAEVEWVTFTHVPVATCVERDSKREGKKCVGKKVIYGMANANGLLESEKPQPPIPYTDADRRDKHTGKELIPAYICDLDGTLAELNGRNPYDATLCMNDKIVRPVLKVIQLLYHHGNFAIVYMSGREERFRHQSLEFLRRNLCPTGPLFMRATYDNRKDFIVKQELFERHIRGKYNVVGVIDDRPSVLRMWQSLGLFTFAVGPLKEF